ncbi:EamA family transporter [Alicyclobacillaceae bacterium I2511]|nr:EamA family transporter [Alicyclobacillaceae bacterium I2511]
MKARRGGILRSVPPTGLVLLSVTSTQFGSAFAKGLFPALGAAGTVALRVGFAALLLMSLWHPRVRGYSRRAYLYVGLFGIALATMNLAFYSALARIPLGVVVTLEFSGPLAVAVVGSRKALDLLWVTFAAAGILLLAPWTGAHYNPLGILLALTAGACWAAYILLSARVGHHIPGIAGLAMAMSIAGLLLVPTGFAKDGWHLVSPLLMMQGLGVSILSSVVPYSVELEALRRLPTHVFGLLMSLEPAMASFAGWLILGEGIGLRGASAMLLIIAASVGTTRGQRTAG